MVNPDCAHRPGDRRGTRFGFSSPRDKLRLRKQEPGHFNLKLTQLKSVTNHHIDSCPITAPSQNKLAACIKFL